MSPRDLFAVAVRTAGLISLFYLLQSVLLLLGVDMQWTSIVRSLVWLILTLWLLRGAPALVRFAYRDGS
jgi:hypothetical protein